MLVLGRAGTLVPANLGILNFVSNNFFATFRDAQSAGILS